MSKWPALLFVVAVGGCRKESVALDHGTPATVAEGGTTSSSNTLRKDRSETATAADNFVVRLERSVCYGLCPAYVVTLLVDGTVEYDGQHFVGVRGRASSHVSPGDVVALVNRFEKAGYWDLTWQDPCPHMSTDSPTATLTLVQRGRKRVVVDYHGNGCVPQAIRDLEDDVDRAVRIAVWTKCDADYCER